MRDVDKQLLFAVLTALFLTLWSKGHRVNLIKRSLKGSEGRFCISVIKSANSKFNNDARITSAKQCHQRNLQKILVRAQIPASLHN